MCAVKDWLENRYRVYLFQESTNTTTWSRYFGFAAETEAPHEDDEDGGSVVATSGDQHRDGGTLLVHSDGAFCFGPRDKVDNLLNMARYAAQRPSYP